LKQKEGDRTIETKRRQNNWNKKNKETEQLKQKEGDRTIETKRRQNNWNKKKKETEQLKQKEEGDRTIETKRRRRQNKLLKQKEEGNFQRNLVSYLELNYFGKKSESAEKQQNSSHWDISSKILSCVTVDVKKKYEA